MAKTQTTPIVDLPRQPDGKFAAQPAPAEQRQVSRAPPPAPPVTPSASKDIDWRSDEASDDQFTKGFFEKMKERNARR